MNINYKRFLWYDIYIYIYIYICIYVYVDDNFTFFCGYFNLILGKNPISYWSIDLNYVFYMTSIYFSILTHYDIDRN